MKKLILATALVLGGFIATNAQTPETKKTEKEPTALNTPPTKKVPVQVEATTDAALDATIAQDQKEVKVSDLPAPVTAALAKDFKGATVSKAYLTANGEYKLEIATVDAANKAKKQTVYANSKGEWIKKQ